MPYFVRPGVGSLWIEGTGPFDTAASMTGKRLAVMKGSYPEIWAREHVPTAIILPVDGTLAELDDALRSGQVDVEVGFYTRQRGVVIVEMSYIKRCSAQALQVIIRCAWSPLGVGKQQGLSESIASSGVPLPRIRVPRFRDALRKLSSARTHHIAAS